MFEKGIVQKVMIQVSLALAGVLVGLAVQPTGAAIKVVLAIVAVVLAAVGYLSTVRLEDDAYRHGQTMAGPKETVV